MNHSFHLQICFIDQQFNLKDQNLIFKKKDLYLNHFRISQNFDLLERAFILNFKCTFHIEYFAAEAQKSRFLK